MNKSPVSRLNGQSLFATPSSDRMTAGEDPVTPTYYKRDFWVGENTKYSTAHHRLEKLARIVNRLAGSNARTLLDVGCGPATLQHHLRANIRYYGIDIAIQEAAPNLLEADITAAPIRFGDERFDFIVAQGLFEYLGAYQDSKLAEIAHLLNPGGAFIISYVNFAHRKPSIYWPYSNVQRIEDFRQDLDKHFSVDKSFPTSLNWNHSEPNRKLMRTLNTFVNVNIPYVTRKLAVEYFFLCSPLHDIRPS